jgi:hypothetical protein
VSVFARNREVIVDHLQPECERLSRALTAMSVACLRKERDRYNEAKAIAEKVMADIRAGFDLLADC